MTLADTRGCGQARMAAIDTNAAIFGHETVQQQPDQGASQQGQRTTTAAKIRLIRAKPETPGRQMALKLAAHPLAWALRRWTCCSPECCREKLRDLDGGQNSRQAMAIAAGSAGVSAQDGGAG